MNVSAESDGLIIGEDGWCGSAVRLESPNFNERPSGTEISLLVIHNISLPAGHFGGPYISDLFLNRLDCSLDPSFESLRGVQVSSHFLIRRDGSLLQFVSAAKRAWHAGASSFGGRSGCNDFSIGIELEGSDAQAFEALQYRRLAGLSAALITAYPLTHITGHSDIAPGRKTDPGPYFDWKFYRRQVQDNFATAPKLAIPAFVFDV
ncbi:1,6-anhydro-N-acetylmuramyl-L-alanine amidase AmpD [Undibacterium sp.]|uniref:1,6-anhydro-N-acetylmuramyl-L-alanine amidase AmpD n=1 Tax=Undibacterium sp. TaxID=1914977 RepID=UPI00374CF121